MKVFVGIDYKILYVNGGFDRPTLIGYVYEYEVEEQDKKYWDSLKPDDQEAIVDEAQKTKTDLRLLIKEKQEKIAKTPF